MASEFFAGDAQLTPALHRPPRCLSPAAASYSLLIPPIRQPSPQNGLPNYASLPDSPLMTSPPNLHYPRLQRSLIYSRPTVMTFFSAGLTQASSNIRPLIFSSSTPRVPSTTHYGSAAYTSRIIAPTNPIRDPRYFQLAQGPRPQMDGTPYLSVSLITTLTASTVQPSDPKHATAATTHLTHFRRPALSAPPTARRYPFRSPFRYNLRLKTRVFPISAKVTPDDPWPLVLGLDFLVAQDCVVHVRERRLVLGQSTTTSAPPTTVDNFDLMFNLLLAAVALVPIPLDTVLPSPSVVGPVAHDQLKILLILFPEFFAWSTDTIGRTHLIRYKIDTRDAKPVWQPPRRIPVRYREEVNKLLDELLQAKIIQPSSSPWTKFSR
ncbi:hypothetical protein SprV_0602219400 [Sparganum proliferum]